MAGVVLGTTSLLAVLALAGLGWRDRRALATKLQTLDRNAESRSTPPGGRRCPNVIAGQLACWDHMARRLRIVAVALGVLAISLSVVVASGLAPDTTNRILAVSAAIATATLTGLNLTAKSNGARNAWRLLHAEVMRYEAGLVADEGEARKRLIDAYERAESLVGDITVVTGQGTTAT